MENFIILGSVILLLALSFLVGIKSKNDDTSSGFLGSSKSFGPLMVALSGTAAVASGWMIVGFPANIYTSGNYMTSNALMAGAFALSYIFIGKKVRALAEVNDIATLGDLIQARYKSTSLRLVASLVLFLGCFAYLAAQISAGASLFTYMFGWDTLTGSVIMFGVVILYVAIGGESAGIVSQAFQGAIMVVVGAIIIGIFFGQGGFAELSNLVAENNTVTGSNGVTHTFEPIMFSAFGTATPAASMNYFLLAWLGTVCQPAILTRMFALKNPRDLPKLAIQTGVTQAIVSFFGIAMGWLVIIFVLSGRIDPLADPSTATWVLGEELGFFIQVLLYTAAVAAIISSASMYLSIGASALSKDVLQCLGFKFDEKKQIKVSRVAIVFVGVASILLAAFSSDTVALLGSLGWATFMTLYIPLILIGLIWKKANKTGMLAAAIIALVGNIIGMLLPLFVDIQWPFGLPWSVYLMAITTFVGVYVSYLTYDEVRDAPAEKNIRALNI
ncbi:sodium:solute symporter family transporter [Fundicoccus culcitae]|uniref:Proline permease n=1 Tax=Fundicoccus culcitae TaxID=2969821 RepID=A0ABY5P8K3_9LACT|nr:hypothetical protein [Fundicoccus culcitae]UUX35076.1 hypothetical protein NRE15_05385 [Fundicoccus culcitae]